MPIDIRALIPTELDAISGAALTACLYMKGQKQGSIAKSSGPVAATAPAGARNDA
jgi:hypothetical protein